jgi:hypothetical protein
MHEIPQPGSSGGERGAHAAPEDRVVAFALAWPVTSQTRKAIASVLAFRAQSRPVADALRSLFCSAKRERCSPGSASLTLICG